MTTRPCPGCGGRGYFPLTVSGKATQLKCTRCAGAGQVAAVPLKNKK